MAKLQPMPMAGRLDFWLRHQSKCRLFMLLVLPMVVLLAKSHQAQEKGHLVLYTLRICGIHQEIRFAHCIGLLNQSN